MLDEYNKAPATSSADEMATNKKKIKPGFHGFLFWVAIYTVLQPFCYLLAFFKFLKKMFLDGADYGDRLIFLGVMCFPLFLFSLLLVKLFFEKRKETVNIYLGFISFGIIVHLICGMPTIFFLVLAVYLLASKRVKATFVKGKSDYEKIQEVTMPDELNEQFTKTSADEAATSKKMRLCKFLSVKSIIHEKGPSMVYKQKVEFPLPIFGFATN